MRTRSRSILSYILLLSLLASWGAIAAPAAAQDEEGVAAYRSATRLEQSIYGPERGTITHEDAAISFVHAGIDVRNFYAKVRVVAPYDGADQTWDAGFTFRYGRDLDWRLAVYSSGRWDVRLGAGDAIASGEVENLEIGEGDANDLEIAIDGANGYLAVNGEEIASFDVSQRGVRGDVLIGAGFTTESTSPGAEMRFSRFQIWELDDDGVQVSDDARDLIEAGRDIADTEEPAGGPLSGELTEDDESVPIEVLGVEVTDLYARVEITNPRDHADHPFDVGLGLRSAGGNDQYRVVIASDGSWYISLGPNVAFACENFDGLNTGDGDTNLFEVAISGDTIAIAVNGDIVGSADVAGLDDAGDVFLGAAFYPAEDFVADGVTPFDDFTVWELTGDGPEPTEEVETPEPTEEVETPEPTEEVETPVSDDPEEIFESYLDETSSLEIVFGPEEGGLEHQADQLTYLPAELDIENFILHVEFINPYDAEDGGWDIGVIFRLGEEEPHARLIVLSNGSWQIGPGTEAPFESGEVPNLNTGDGDTNVLDLVVIGDVGYFGVNGDFVAELDLSEFDHSGDVAVATAFFEDNFDEGAETGVEDFLVWELDDVTPPDEPTEEPTRESSATATSGDRYESPTFGYAVAYDADEWTIDSESSENDVDMVRFGNGTSTVDFTGFETPNSPDECLDAEFAFYQDAEGYSNVEVAVDDDDEELRGETDDYVWGTFWFTYTPEGGNSVDYTSYVECRPLGDGEAMLRIVHFAPFDDYEDEIEPRESLLEGLSLDSGSNGPAPTVEPTATEESGEETPVATGDTIVVLIDAMDDSNASGIATLEADGNRTNVTVLAIGAGDEAILVIQEGTCDDLAGEAAFELDPIETSISETRIRISLDDLTTDDYSITIHESEDDLDQPLACGQIVAVD
ncbi:MAG: hypothetical protein IT336_07010 [Thermomicrobiales bacterium]|nr:hypothetical protein [Thermomicrobiales bacterium]